ncbi:MAG TPA: hypothetical protein VND65_08520 [Candidatus Binatia bacterium]|nr:hypothetical protein [Candidatus Binatia bacterium]
MSTQRVIAPEPQARMELSPLVESDLHQLAAFIGQQSGRDAAVVEKHLRWFLLQNPARSSHDPLGFALRTSEGLSGCILCVPQKFHFQDREILLMGSSSFYVDESHRGHGGRIFLQYSRLAKNFPLFGTSANPDAAALWRAAGASPIPSSDGELFGILRWPPFGEEFAHRKNLNTAAVHLAASPLAHVAGWFQKLMLDTDSSTRLERLTSPEQVDALPIHGEPSKLTAQRDLAYIRWRYFSGHDPTAAAFSWRSSETGGEILVTVNRRARGYRGQIKSLNILDVYPEVSAAESLKIIGGLVQQYRTTVDAIVLRHQDPDRRRFFLGRGLRWRPFDAPLGWLLDRQNFLPTRDLYFVPADGDGLI